VATINFSAQVSSFVRQTEQRMTAVFKESVQRVHEQAVNRAAVDFGFMRAGIRITKNQPAPLVAAPQVKKTVPYDPSVAVLAIGGLKIGDRAWITATANYSGFVEFGTSKTPPQPFMRPAAQQWPGIVARVSRELQSRVEGRSSGRTP
jgi:HK97 gp10 family phage protein